MKWGDVKAARLGWSRADTGVAVTMASAQLPAAFVVQMADFSGQDDYGAGFGSPLGLLCVGVTAPLWLPLIGLGQTVLLGWPTGVLAWCGSRVGTRVGARVGVRLRGRVRGGVGGDVRVRAPAGSGTLKGRGGSEWGWHLAAVAVVAALWALLGTLTLGAAYLPIALGLTALGVLPALAVTARRRSAREWSTWRLWWGGALASTSLFFTAFAGLAALESSGLLPEYEPPQLSAERLAGVWRGADHAELRLHPDGRAEATALPAEIPFEASIAKEYVVCAGPGTWFLDTDGPYDYYGNEGPDVRDVVVVRLDDDACGEDTYWVIGGTTAEPELYVRFGDPDAGELRILRPESP